MNRRPRLILSTALILVLAAAGVIFTGSLVAKGRTLEVTLRYTGTRLNAPVTVSQSRPGEDAAVVFEGVAQPGQVFAVEGVVCDDTPGSLMNVFVDGELDTSVPVDCGGTLGPRGGGDFVVVHATNDRIGGTAEETRTRIPTKTRTRIPTRIPTGTPIPTMTMATAAANATAR